MLQYKPRIEDRTKVMIRARLRGAGPEREACIVDLSSRGLAASADNPPQRGAFVELLVGDVVLIGQVKWSSMRRFGMAFRERISVVGLIAGDDSVTLRQQDAARQRSARRQGAPAAGSVAKKIEFLILIAAGVGATFFLADFVDSSLQPLDDAKMAMAGDHPARPRGDR